MIALAYSFDVVAGEGSPPTTILVGPQQVVGGGPSPAMTVWLLPPQFVVR